METNAATENTTVTEQSSPAFRGKINGDPQKRSTLLQLAQAYGSPDGINWKLAWSEHPEWCGILEADPAAATPQHLYQAVSDLRRLGILPKTNQSAALSAAITKRQTGTKKGVGVGKSLARPDVQRLLSALALAPEPITTDTLVSTGHWTRTSASTALLRYKVKGWLKGLGDGRYQRSKKFPPGAKDLRTEVLPVGQERAKFLKPRKSFPGGYKAQGAANIAAALHLPEPIRAADVARVTRCTEKASASMLHRWAKRGYVKTVAFGQYVRTPFYPGLQAGATNGNTPHAEPAPQPAAQQIPSVVVRFCPCCGTDIDTLFMAARALSERAAARRS